MSGTSEPEFSRPITLARLGAEPFRREIAADEAERQALARRFELIALDRLSAAVELIRQGNDRILLRAAFDAAFVQRCVVTLDPVAGAMSERFTLLYGPPEAEAEAGGSIPDEPAFEPLLGDVIDIGEAVAQEFALALPPFPRCAGVDADVEPPTPGPAANEGPFAALARLADRNNG